MRVMGWIVRVGFWGLLALILVGCFQAAGNPVEPTIANSTATPPPTAVPTATPDTVPFTDTPAVTNVPPSGDGASTPQPPAMTSAPTDTANAPATLPPTQPSSDLSATPGNLALNPPTNSPDSGTSGSGAASAVPSASALPNTPTPFATEGPCVHTVQPGEHMYSIARLYKVAYDALLAANPRFAAAPDQLQPGDVLQIPSCVQPTAPGATAVGPAAPPASPGVGTVYSVVAGDTLNGIAHKYGVTVQQIQAANGLKSDRLSIGQKLIIPSP